MPPRAERTIKLLVLDLPDLDSIEPSHAERVDQLLPRVDAVLWVTDPEKYQDAVLHDAYLHLWMAGSRARPSSSTRSTGSTPPIAIACEPIWLGSCATRARPT